MSTGFISAAGYSSRFSTRMTRRRDRRSLPLLFLPLEPGSPTSPGGRNFFFWLSTTDSLLGAISRTPARFPGRRDRSRHRTMKFAALNTIIDQERVKDERRRRRSSSSSSPIEDPCLVDEDLFLSRFLHGRVLAIPAPSS